MATGDDIQHRYRMLTVRTIFLFSSSYSGPFIASSPVWDVHPTSGVFVSLVTRIGPWVCDRPRDLITYAFFSLCCSYSATQFNEAKRWFESATVLCRFVADGVAKAEKVRDGSRSFHP